MLPRRLLPGSKPKRRRQVILTPDTLKKIFGKRFVARQTGIVFVVMLSCFCQLSFCGQFAQYTEKQAVKA